MKTIIAIASYWPHHGDNLIGRAFDHATKTWSRAPSLNPNRRKRSASGGDVAASFAGGRYRMSRLSMSGNSKLL
ncbi:MAG: hypothetical protein H7343_17705 [Undibacterium sp.]|nr:hypothetical protein [Opitutaceae bacterium]